MESGYLSAITIITTGQPHGRDAAAAELNRSARQDGTSTAVEWMPAPLFEAWQILRRDLNVPDAIMPVLAEDDWSDDQNVLVTAATWWPDGSGAGISVSPHEQLADRL